MYWTAAESFTSTGQGTNFGIGTTPIGSVTRTERLTILNNGNVGIGISTPPAKFSIYGGDDKDLGPIINM